MKIAILSHSGFKGGAAIASKRLYCALSKYNHGNLEINFLTPEKKNGFITKKISNNIWRILIKISFILKKILIKTNPHYLSFGFFSRIDLSEICKYEILNLHWINNSTFSINLMNKFQKPIVWTLHDCWPILGINHHCDDSEFLKYHTSKYQNTKFNSIYEFFDKWNLRRKDKIYRQIYKKLVFVSPSKWLLEKAKKSYISKKCNIVHIPNPYNEKEFFYKSQLNSKQTLKIKTKDFVICYGAKNFLTDKNKGWDLFYKSIISLPESLQSKITLICFGDIFKESSKYQWKIKRLINPSFVRDNMLLNTIYNSSDLIIVPSRYENMPQIAVEALACGCLVYGYKIGGIPEIINSPLHGKLFDPFVTIDFSRVINNFKGSEDSKYLKEREDRANYAKLNWSSEVISKKYSELFISISNKEK